MAYLGLGEKQVLVTIATPGSIVSDGWERQVRELQGGGTYSELQRMVEEVFGAVRLADVRILQVPYSVINEARLAGITPQQVFGYSPAGPVCHSSPYRSSPDDG